MTLLARSMPDSPALKHRRFSVDEYHRMAESGILDENDQVELLEGWIVEKMTKNPRHEATIQAVDDVVRARISPDWRIRIQSAITLADSEPEPDLAVVRGVPSRYNDHHPGPADVALIVEVAESTLAQDRGIKLRVYARAGIATYWIVNLVENVVEVYSDPTPDVEQPTYRHRRVYRSGEELDITVGAESLKPVPVREILGR